MSAGDTVYRAREQPGQNDANDVAEDNYGFVTVVEARRAGIRPQRLAEMARRGSLRREGYALYLRGA